MQHSPVREAHSSTAVTLVSLWHEKGGRNRLVCSGAGALSSACSDAGSCPEQAPPALLGLPVTWQGGTADPS